MGKFPNLNSSDSQIQEIYPISFDEDEAQKAPLRINLCDARAILSPEAYARQQADLQALSNARRIGPANDELVN